MRECERENDGEMEGWREGRMMRERGRMIGERGKSLSDNTHTPLK